MEKRSWGWRACYDSSAKPRTSALSFSIMNILNWHAKSHASHGVDLAKNCQGLWLLSSQTIYDYDTLNAVNLPNDLVDLAYCGKITDNPPRALPNVDSIYIKTRFGNGLAIIHVKQML